MKSYADFTTAGADNVHKAGSTQPQPNSSDMPEKDTSSVVKGFVGKEGGPTVVPTGATNSGYGSRGARGHQR